MLGRESIGHCEKKNHLFNFGIFHPLCYTITWCNIYLQTQHNNVCLDYRDVIVKFNMTTCFGRLATILRSTRVNIYYMQRKIYKQWHPIELYFVAINIG
jgi:hypothetical protein